ncbi:heavy-metal-associated domain-containing protein [Flavobacterium seoulense]|uniref:HMA domain-containing protein n=1 Tax=Flavobacterium seoulense TaxID=1492738 RepID=A0A066WQ33_9FLAO|nr:heavy-metal-associated domain-containing protein [Flavobacterium seoulense]KDN56167.1 hypothetical protein FEM21_07190 [Flavobacterium seoulense]
MSLLSDNIIPGEHGKVFGTNADHETELKQIKNALLKLDGVTEVQINNTIFPKEFTVFTNKMISVEDIETTVIATGFHAIPKALI